MRRYYEGTLLMGVSAGAVQLGLMTWPEGASPSSDFTETFKLVPFIISAHDEKGDWAALKSAVQSTGGSFHGLGLPTGGGAVYHPDHSVEPVRYALYEFSYNNASIVTTVLHYPDPDIQS